MMTYEDLDDMHDHVDDMLKTLEEFDWAVPDGWMLLVDEVHVLDDSMFSWLEYEPCIESSPHGWINITTDPNDNPDGGDPEENRG